MFKRLNRLRGWWSDRQSRRELARRKAEALALAEIHERLARAKAAGHDVSFLEGMLKYGATSRLGDKLLERIGF